jgi:hypothetical protein
MDQFALCMQAIGREEQLLNPRLQEGLGESSRGIVAKQVLPTIPHGLQYQAAVVAARPRENQLVQGSSQMAIPRM